MISLIIPRGPNLSLYIKNQNNPLRQFFFFFINKFMAKLFQQSPSPQRGKKKESNQAPPENDNETTAVSLDELTKDLEESDLQEIAPTVGAPPIGQEVIERIVARLAHKCYLSPKNAFAAIALLFLKGAASKSAPDKMFVEVKAVDGGLAKVYKGDLMQVVFDSTGNRFIRRLAESLAIPISNFAERHSLDGDLAFSFDIEAISEGQDPLTPKERAWSNSFCQHISDLDLRAGTRVKALLGQDYQNRFNKKKPKKKKKEERPAPNDKKKN